ncbi:hypothetical protein SARC_13494 [Sphaeroforma arctica JP610]|uniref:ERCC3/RAD25/XPB helicase C-terminal domain-containing protein n=1 Tax=Sphaeroforma arctica JP610 TaxID=667725 RepID=A0A0L0FB04_9EUKA|nr:hypothetical protein SARC_13494 [Sphaeroforma arctica JP610]KNC73945.1 hypothetical protein SARC_13494 [Sphaeroforma arctica JP610]|eukprot:XP_014147847.1 hypothetical protein SARC_13494 [Sphaeroforma arctica JP610]
MYGSRRQEAQRLGRILRAKKGQPKPGPEDYNAHFYSLVSKDTAEMYFSTKRQQFLVDQGYAFEVIDKVPGMDKYGILTKAQEKNLLAAVLDAMDNETQEEDLSGFDPDTVGRKAGRRKGNLSGLSGGEGMVYNEYKSKQPKARHALFKHRDKR